jgi:Fe-S-cluster containining protein
LSNAPAAQIAIGYSGAVSRHLFVHLSQFAKRNTDMTPAPGPIDQLCPNCGLCCDSTLFADVELRRGDDPRRLAKLGLTIEQKTKARLAFAQPCACFDGQLCRIYGDRPKRCRLFECGLLKRVASGAMTAGAALKKIAEAKARAEKVRGLLRQSGRQAETMALTHRYTEAMSAPVDLAVEGAADRRGELMLAVNDLMQLLEREFLQ